MSSGGIIAEASTGWGLRVGIIESPNGKGVTNDLLQVQAIGLYITS